MTERELLLTRSVFVVGRQPSVTDNARDERKLEQEVKLCL